MPLSAPRRYRTVALLFAAAGIGCSDGSVDPSNAPPSRAFGVWQPGTFDTCTKEQHDAYAAVGRDGKLYPTWHPPTGPGGCTFGHEHGRDPDGSALDVGDIPFGYANEQLALSDPANPRDEDHVGHKVEWQNDVKLQFSGPGSVIFEVECDVLTKLHQGTHSKDAFTNNVHELVYHIDCSDGTEMHVTMLAAIGNPGEFVRGCNRDVHITVGPATPANSPDGGGFRAIPDRTCIEQHMLVADGQNSNYHNALHENWETSNSIRREDGHTLAFFNPYFQVRRPSRFYDPALAPTVGRPIAICYETTPEGERARGGECEDATNNGATAGITFDDPQSPFDGSRRFVDINSNHISNADGPEVWYTDAYGRHGQREPFTGSIRQWIASLENGAGGGASGPVLGDDRLYGNNATHAPN